MRQTIAAAILGAATMTAPAAADPFPEKAQGLYGPNAECFEFSIRIGRDSVEIAYGGDALILEDWDVCLSCAGGAQYQGVEVMSFPRIGLDVAPIFRVNAEEQEGRLLIEYYGDAALPFELQQAVDTGEFLECR